jgi:hypothetical protein
MAMKKKETAPSGSNTAATGNSPGSALPVGKAAKIPIIPGYGPGPRIGDLQVVVLDVLRSKDAEDRVQSSGIPVEKLKTGFENVLIHVKAGYASSGRGPREQPYNMTEGQFLAGSADGGTEYQVRPFSGKAEEKLIGRTFISGDSREGWFLCQLPKNETKPLLMFRRGNVDNVWGLWSDVWFQLYQ